MLSSGCLAGKVKKMRKLESAVIENNLPLKYNAAALEKELSWITIEGGETVQQLV